MKPTSSAGRSPAGGRPALRPWVDAPPPAAVTAAAEPRQRWRIVYARLPDAPPSTQRDDLAAWEAGLAASGLPLVGMDRPNPRPRLQFGAPLPQGVAAERELADVWLAERLTVDRVRPAIVASLPPGHALVDLHDVWIGAPPLPADVVAADYRVTTDHDAPPGWEIATAARRLLATERLDRERQKGGGTVHYDLRPLLADVTVIAPGPPPVIRIRVRFDAALGHGRPEEVLAALGVLLGREIRASAMVRESLVLTEHGQARSGSHPPSN